MSKKYIKVAQVTSAVLLSKNQLKEVRTWVKSSIGEGVELRTQVDPSVIAGIRVRAGDWLFDGTFQGELERFKNTLGTS